MHRVSVPLCGKAKCAFVSQIHSLDIQVNKTELDNIMLHFGDGTTCDVAGAGSCCAQPPAAESRLVSIILRAPCLTAFLGALGPPPSFPGTTFGIDPPESPYKKHLSLSGIAHVGRGAEFLAARPLEPCLRPIWAGKADSTSICQHLLPPGCRLNEHMQQRMQQRLLGVELAHE